MPLDKLKVKYKQLAEGVISDKAAELLWERCLKLEDLDNVRDLFAGL